MVDCKCNFWGKEKAYVDKYPIQVFLHTEITGVQLITSQRQHELSLTTSVGNTKTMKGSSTFQIVQWLASLKHYSSTLSTIPSRATEP